MTSSVGDNGRGPAPSVFDVEGVDALYDLEPSAFTAARNRLVKELRGSDARALADAVKKLSRPSVAAWATNQVARAGPGDIDRLVELGEQMRQAQADLLEGGGPSALREAGDARRDLIQRLAARGAQLAGEGHRSDIAATLDAASLDPARIDALRAGHLEDTLEPPSGFDLAGLPDEDTAVSRRREQRSERQRLARELEEASEAVEKAETRLRRAQSRREEAQAALERAERAVDDATHAVADASEATASIRAQLEALEG